MSLRLRKLSNSGHKSQSGQSLLETALAMPLLLGLAFNIVNFGYMWFMVLTLSAAPRMGVQYATQGGASGTSTAAPSTTSVSDLVYDNLTHAISGATASNVSVQVCSSAKGVNAATNVALCDNFGPAFPFPTPAADPEAPLFVLDRVNVKYTLEPIIPGTVFNIILPANLTCHRQVSMRSLY
jgi:Flp pilus assembly protein TadG